MKKQVTFLALCLVSLLCSAPVGAQSGMVKTLLKKELSLVLKEGAENICNWLSDTYIKKSQQEAMLYLRAETAVPFYSSKGHAYTYVNEFRADFIPLYSAPCKGKVYSKKLEKKMRTLANESLFYVRTNPCLDAQYPHRLDHHLNQRLPGTAYSTLKLKEKGLDLHYSYETQSLRWDNVLKTTGAAAGTGYAARKVKKKTGRQ